MSVAIKPTSGPVIERTGDLSAILTNLQKKEVLFIDEIHRLHPSVEELLYSAMEDFSLDLIIGQGPSARSHKLQLRKFTLIGATTRAGRITAPLRGRFGIIHRLDYYKDEDLKKIIGRSADLLEVAIDAAALSTSPEVEGNPRGPTGLRCSATTRMSATDHTKEAKQALDMMKWTRWTK
jgi:Holliday junction DNA helicase RuvB